MPRPVLFLDVDGVLCTPLSVRLDQVFRRPMDRQFFDPVALFWLQKLVRRTGAQVVLSSSWRYALEDGDLFTGRILQNLYDCLAAHGAPVAGIAPILGVSKGRRSPPGSRTTRRRPMSSWTTAPTSLPPCRPSSPTWSWWTAARGFRRRDFRQALALFTTQTTKKEVQPHDRL